MIGDNGAAVVVIGHLAGVRRAEVAPTLVDDGRGAAHVLVGVDAEPVQRPTHQLMCRSIRFHSLILSLVLGSFALFCRKVIARPVNFEYIIINRRNYAILWQHF